MAGRVAIANRATLSSADPDRTGSVIPNGNFRQRPSVLTAATNTANRWIDGTGAGSSAKLAYGWSAPSAGSGVGANAEIGFDTTIFRTGAASLRLSNLNASGAVTAASLRAATPTASTLFELFRLQPNTTHTLKAYIRTNNVPSNGAFIDLRQFSANGTTLVTTSTNKLSGTDTSWRLVTLTITTNASAAFGCLFLRNNVAGNISDAWFDDITLAPTVTTRVTAVNRIDPRFYGLTPGESYAKVGLAASGSDADFVANPTSAQSALTAAFAQSNVVCVLDGAYGFADTYAMASGKKLIMESSNAILRMNAGVNKTVLTNADASTGITSGVKIYGGTIDQQGALQSAGGGLVVTGIQNWIIENTIFKKSNRFNFLTLHQAANATTRSGLATLTKGSATMTGSGTAFLTEVTVGAIIKSAGGQFGRVQSIETNTSLTLTLLWGSATETSVTFKIIQPNSGCRLSRVQFQGTTNDADASGYGFFDDGIVEDCISTGANAGGCGFVPDHARNMQLNRLISYGNDNSGISLETSEDCVINDPRTFANINGNGVQFISGTSRCRVRRGLSYGHTNNGYAVSYNITTAGIPLSNVFELCFGYLNGGYAFRNDGGMSTEYDRVRGYNNNTGGLIVNTANSNVPDLVNIHDSLFFDDRAVISQDRGIYIAAGTNTSVINNTALDALHTIAGIVDSGTGTISSGNTT